MVITELSEYKGETWKLVIDDEQTFYVNESIVCEFSLRKGLELCDAALEQIQGSDTVRKAKRRALYLLGSRQYCYNELYKKLCTTYSEDIARSAADSMREYGYINDEDYAPKLADYLIHTKHYGLRKTRYEMLHRGLDENLVEDVLSEITEDEVDEEITALLERKYYGKLKDYDQRQRTIAALARRGYDYRAVKHCIEALLENYEDDEDFE